MKKIEEFEYVTIYYNEEFEVYEAFGEDENGFESDFGTNDTLQGMRSDVYYYFKLTDEELAERYKNSWN